MTDSADDHGTAEVGTGRIAQAGESLPPVPGRVAQGDATRPPAPGRIAQAGGSPSPVTGRGKRQRLVAAACEVIYAQGAEHTTLANVAAAAGVPLGNVYYYFKTKDDLVQAVIDTRLAQATALLAAIEASTADPRERVKSLVHGLAGDSELIAQYGCPLGSLCMELDKRPGGPGPAASLLRVPVDWTERQFTEMGRSDAADLAIELMARYQGAALLASTFRDPALMTRAAARVAAWLDTLA